jgi:hypothetical protein
MLGKQQTNTSSNVTQQTSLSVNSQKFKFLSMSRKNFKFQPFLILFWPNGDVGKFQHNYNTV